MDYSSEKPATQRSTPVDADSAVDIDVAVDGIYSFHLIQVTASSPAAFAMEVCESRIYRTKCGAQHSEYLVSSVNNGRSHRIIVSVIGVYAQLPTALKAELRYGKGPGVERAEYGVRFYPFISSILRFQFRLIQGSVRAFFVNNDEEVRVLWSHASFSDEEGHELPRQVAHSRIGWQEALAWLPPDERPQSLVIQVPVRASSRAISKSILHPTFTWTASMVAITLAAQLATNEVIVAAVVGTWSFLLREWAGSARAHQINLLSGIFFFQAFSAATWGVALAISAPVAIVLGSMLAVFTVDLFLASVRFEYRGRLPRRLAVPWAWMAKSLERLRARRRRRLQLTGFDYERTAGP